MEKNKGAGQTQGPLESTKFLYLGVNRVSDSSEMPAVTALWAPTLEPGQRPSAPAPCWLTSGVCDTTASGSDRVLACTFLGSRAFVPHNQISGEEG